MRFLPNCRPLQLLSRSRFCLALTLATALLLPAQAPKPDSPAIDAQAKALLARLSLEQKITLLGGYNSMFTHPMPEIGLPSLKSSDATVGIRTFGTSNAYAGGQAMAATWDRNFSRQLGEAVAHDAHARGVHFVLGPGVNIARTPVAGRNFEYLSEDPYLNAELVVPYIEGMQSQGVVATVKHFALNNQEYDRHNVDVSIDERTLREIYLPAFEAAVTRAHVDAVMNSYNLVNGQHATQSDFLNLKILKGEWGFRGLLMSDWVATYDSVAAANAGLDLEMPSAAFLNAQALIPAVKSGAVKESVIDDKVLRLLRVAIRYGFLDHDQFDTRYSIYSVPGREVALQGARESLTLLKNEGQILPLNPNKIKTIAIIGPNAYPAVPTGGGSAQVSPFEPVSLLTGVANLLGPEKTLLYSSGLPAMTDVFDQTRWLHGVEIATFPSRNFTGTPVPSHDEKISSFNIKLWGPDDPSPKTIRYTAAYRAEKSGKYMLLADASGTDSYTLKVDGRETLVQPAIEGQVPRSAILDLTTGQTIELVADYKPIMSGIRLGVGIMPLDELISNEAKKMAAAADAVILAVGYSPVTESESSDRTFTLPWGQDELIEAIEAINPRAIVASTGGLGFDTHRWLSHTPAFVHLYYPGQEGGTAFAELLFGKLNPEGHLPVTFDRSFDENPSARYYYPIPGANTSLHSVAPNGTATNYTIPHLRYDDRLMVGYRYWTTTGKHPLYPFGFGLSYTSFAFSALEAPTTAKSGSTVPVSFTVTNTGGVAGATVAQLYLSDPSAHIDRPERELKGFEKLRLKPGESQRVTLELDARAFSYWDEKSHYWAIDPGKFLIRIGDSSENTPLEAAITIQ